MNLIHSRAIKNPPSFILLIQGNKEKENRTSLFLLIQTDRKKAATLPTVKY